MTQHTTIAFDLYNKNFSAKINDKTCLWNSIEEVVTATGFPYASTIRILFYEPERNIYHIEREAGVQVISKDLEEFQWLDTNLAVIESAIDAKLAAAVPLITMDMTRIGKLYQTDWLIQRHQDQLLAGTSPSLTEQKLSDLLAYRQALRDLPLTVSKDADPETVIWPTYSL